MVVRRSRTVAAPVDDVWRIVRDPYHLPRWWPRTQRVEGVSSSGWTSVLVTDKGRAIRADYRVELSKGSERRRLVAGARGDAVRGAVPRGRVRARRWRPPTAGTEVGIEMRQKPKRLGALRRR